MKIILTITIGNISLIPEELCSTVEIRKGNKLVKSKQFGNDRKAMSNFIEGFKDAANLAGIKVENELPRSRAARYLMC